MKDIKEIKLSDIEVANRYRKDMSGIQELADSIEEVTLLNPITVVQQDKKKPYKLLAGGRRIEAHKLLKRTKIPAVIFEDLGGLDSVVIEYVENAHRKDLTWPEEVAIKKAVNDYYTKKYGKRGRGPTAKGEEEGHSVKKTAKIFGESLQNTRVDINLAGAVEVIPELKKCKTKTEARKAMEHAEDAMLRRELARRIEEQKASTPVQRAKKELITSYIIGDFFEEIKKVPDNSIDIIEMDPPYGVNLPQLAKNRPTGQELSAEDYNEIDVDSYNKFIFGVLKECYRVLNQGWLIIWYPESLLLKSEIKDYMDIGEVLWPHMLYLNLTSIGFKVRPLPARWFKGSGSSQAPEIHLANDVEVFMYARKGEAMLNRKGRSSVFHYNSVPHNRRTHPAERPIEMIQEVLETFGTAGQRVLVPFLGSGNTLLAAANLNMPAFGYDLGAKGNPNKYKDAFTVKVNEGMPGEYRSYSHEQ